MIHIENEEKNNIYRNVFCKLLPRSQIQLSPKAANNNSNENNNEGKELLEVIDVYGIDYDGGCMGVC